MEQTRTACTAEDPRTWCQVRRYLRTLRLFWTCALAAEMEYRLNFVLATLNSLLGLAGSIFSLFLFYRLGHQLGGWSWEEALLVMGAFTLLEGFSVTILSANLSRIVAHVREGTLDFVLIKPIDSQFWLSLRNVSIWGVPNLCFGVGLILFAGSRLHFGLRQYLMGMVPMALGLLILYNLWFALAALSIWFVKVHNVTYLLRSFMEAGRYPVTAYPLAYRLFFTFVLPVAFLTTVPAQAMLGRAAWYSWGLAALLALLLSVLARNAWRFSLRSYTSASS